MLTCPCHYLSQQSSEMSCMYQLGRTSRTQRIKCWKDCWCVLRSCWGVPIVRPEDPRRGMCTPSLSSCTRWWVVGDPGETSASRTEVSIYCPTTSVHISASCFILTIMEMFQWAEVATTSFLQSRFQWIKVSLNHPVWFFETLFARNHVLLQYFYYIDPMKPIFIKKIYFSFLYSTVIDKTLADTFSCWQRLWRGCSKALFWDLTLQVWTWQSPWLAVYVAAGTKIRRTDLTSGSSESSWKKCKLGCKCAILINRLIKLFNKYKTLRNVD